MLRGGREEGRNGSGFFRRPKENKKGGGEKKHGLSAMVADRKEGKENEMNHTHLGKKRGRGFSSISSGGEGKKRRKTIRR